MESFIPDLNALLLNSINPDINTGTCFVDIQFIHYINIKRVRQTFYIYF